MRPGCMIYSLGRAIRDGALTVPGALRLMKEVGVEGVDLDTHHAAGIPLPELRAMVSDAGLVTSCYIGGAELTGPDGPARRKGVDAVRRVLDAAAELGAPVALITTGGCAEGQPRSDARRNVAAALSQVLPNARALAVVPTIEDFGGGRSPYQTGTECLEVCELAGPDLKMTYDSGNMLMGDDDPVDFLEVVKSRVVHAHAKDWAPIDPAEQRGLTSRAGKRYVGELVGRGVIDYPAVFRALKAMSYDGFLSFEYEGDGDQIQAARDGMVFLLAGMAREA